MASIALYRGIGRVSSGSSGSRSPSVGLTGVLGVEEFFLLTTFLLAFCTWHKRSDIVEACVTYTLVVTVLRVTTLILIFIFVLGSVWYRNWCLRLLRAFLLRPPEH